MLLNNKQLHQVSDDFVLKWIPKTGILWHLMNSKDTFDFILFINVMDVVLLFPKKKRSLVNEYIFSWWKLVLFFWTSEKGFHYSVVISIHFHKVQIFKTRQLKEQPGFTLW